MSEIIFDEDVSFTHPLTPEVQVPDKGFEGWFYRKFPGGYYFKKTILYGIIILLFSITLFFVALARFNIQTDRIEFEDRTSTTEI